MKTINKRTGAARAAMASIAALFVPELKPFQVLGISSRNTLQPGRCDLSRDGALRYGQIERLRKGQRKLAKPIRYRKLPNDNTN